jgi:uncharacterized phosphosugar-binding protein
MTQMSEGIHNYISSLQSKIADLSTANLPVLDRAAEICSKSILSKRVIHIYDTGHIISHEMIMRTGGLVAYTHLSFEGMVENNNLARLENQDNQQNNMDVYFSEKTLVQWLFTKNKLLSGDVLILGSVSGLGIRVIELAIQAKEHGLTVIALTGVDFSKQLESKHPSGKHLFEVADIVLDNQVEYGDAFLDIPGFDLKICPSSGITSTILMWSLTVSIVEKIVNSGVHPSVYTSVNLPNGPAMVEQIEKEYKQNGV